MIRERWLLRGEVQGVGLRPTLARLARAHGLTGRVANDAQGVVLELQGPASALQACWSALAELPPPIRLQKRDRQARCVDPTEAAFVIAPSAKDGGSLAGLLPPDLAPCGACCAELDDARNRRHRYPFIACCQCGPRASVATQAPFDRERSAQAPFALCGRCQAEFEDPSDRRYHAQLSACPACGPRLSFGEMLGEDALQHAILELKAGAVLAVKGVGGYQLLCDATRPEPVARIRALKARPDKPLALLMADVEAARAWVCVDTIAAGLLSGPAAPIVVLPARLRTGLAQGVAQGSPNLGLMLPASPLHRLLAQGMGRPLVCTSANAAGAAMVVQAEALGPLSADGVLDHDRAVLLPLDDGVQRPSRRGPIVLRRARGDVPRALSAPFDGPTVLALGAQLKIAPALARGAWVHLGAPAEAMDSLAAEQRLRAEIDRLTQGSPVQAIACDLHPDLPTTRLAEALAAQAGVPLIRVQHHAAHAYAVIAENAFAGTVLALTWDGFGLGSDGGAWGGEALRIEGPRCDRVASLRPIPMPGGDAAAREPERVGRALLQVLGLPAPPGVQSRRDAAGQRALRALTASPRCPHSSSMGRLFDGVAWLCGGPARLSYEGQGAQFLEDLADQWKGEAPPWDMERNADSSGLQRTDWGALVTGLVQARTQGEPPARLALRFHRSLVGLAVVLAQTESAATVALAGGCFQNLRLVDEISDALEARGCSVLRARSLPPNDGALAYGQCVAARYRLNLE